MKRPATPPGTPEPPLKRANVDGEAETGMSVEVDVGEVTDFTRAVYALQFPHLKARTAAMKLYHDDLVHALGAEYKTLESEYVEEQKSAGSTRSRRASGNYTNSVVKESAVSRALPRLNIYLKQKAINEQKKARDEIMKSRGVRDDIADESLSITAVQVGHGDCTVIKTPLGKIIMIDCGSAGQINEIGNRPGERVPDNEVLDQIRAMLGTKRIIDILVLTHADQDHHNKFRWMLDKIGIAKIKVIYHTDKLDQYKVGNDSSKYASTAILERCEATDVKRVLLAGNRCRLFINTGRIEGVVPPKVGTAEISLEKIDADGSLIVHQEKDCTIRFVAAEVDVPTNLNYERPALPDTPSELLNGASIVTLIEGCGQKILVCGDATVKTEAAMLEKFPGPRLKNITILRVAHHGSNLHCSGEDFLDHVKATTAIVSTGVKVEHGFPQIDVLERCWEHVAAYEEPNNVWYWVGDKKPNKQHDNLFEDREKRYSGDPAKHQRLKKLRLWATGSTGAVVLSFKAPVG